MINARTDVYFNLHSGLWSLVERSTGLVYDHARVVVSSLPVALVVQPAGQRKVVAEQQKNVHAYVRGSYLEPSEDVAPWLEQVKELGMIPVSYNPYRGPSFYRKDSNADLKGLKSVIMLAPPDGPPSMWGMV